MVCALETSSHAAGGAIVSPEQTLLVTWQHIVQETETGFTNTTSLLKWIIEEGISVHV